MRLDNNLQAFFTLAKAGLWEQEAQLSLYTGLDFSKLLNIAEEQSVVGLVTAGLDKVVDVKVPQVEVLQFVGSSLQIEQQNLAMNDFISKLIERLRKEDIYAILVKGQGIAQCYQKPLWRSSGDVDLLLSDSNYERAYKTLSSLASSVDEENPYNKHIAMTINGWTVELHGTLKSGLWRHVDKTLDDVQRSVFYGGSVRSWLNGNTQVFLPGVDEDVVFVFSHILQHYFKEGIGLRQICDWCRLLWKYREKIDKKLLGERLNAMGVLTEWKAFAALAVYYLGMSVDAIPFYSSDVRWKRKAARIMEFILETGNFGHNRDYSYYRKYPYLVFKSISFWRHITDTFSYFRIFPLDSLKVLFRKMWVGVSVAVRGKRHE